MAPPVVSVVTATYNRSNVLRVAIESVRGQGFDRWEHIVVGDCCTDDSASVVSSCRDPRITWENLTSNTGDQSGPNNVGVERSRGRYIAFLNHDDVWFPDHLEIAVEAIEASGADLVFTLGAALPRSGRLEMTGRTSDGRYSLMTFAPASTWLFRRELFDRVGAWLPPSASREVPSQHWLRRALATGAELRSAPKLTVVHVASTAFEGSYRTRRAVEQEEALARLRHNVEEFRSELLTRMLLEPNPTSWPRPIAANLRTLVRDVAYRTSARLGVHPHAMAAALRLQRRGQWLNPVYERRGIERERRKH